MCGATWTASSLEVYHRRLPVKRLKHHHLCPKKSVFARLAVRPSSNQKSFHASKNLKKTFARSGAEPLRYDSPLITLHTRKLPMPFRFVFRKWAVLFCIFEQARARTRNEGRSRAVCATGAAFASPRAAHGGASLDGCTVFCALASLVVP